MSNLKRFDLEKKGSKHLIIWNRWSIAFTLLHYQNLTIIGNECDKRIGFFLTEKHGYLRKHQVPVVSNICRCSEVLNHRTDQSLVIARNQIVLYWYNPTFSRLVSSNQHFRTNSLDQLFGRSTFPNTAKQLHLTYNKSRTASIRKLQYGARGVQVSGLTTENAIHQK